jgi:hypothetical protein
MPDPNSVSPGSNTGHVDLSNAPAADKDWDSLFPNPELPASQPQVANPGTTPQQQPQAPQPDQPFLRAGDTVYNTAEDAANGVAHKDAVIAKYRNFLAQNGLDPNALLKDEFQRTPQASPQPQPPQDSKYKYIGNPDFFEQVSQAATSRDKVQYEKLMTAHAREVAQAAIQEMIDPWRATLAETNRTKAIRQATTEVPSFGNFIDGPGYKKVMDSFPLYKEMVQIGENDPVAAQRLPEVYKSMYLIYQGMNQSQAQPQTTTATPITPTVRQQATLQPSALTPPAPAPNPQGWSQPITNRLKRDSNESRTALIRDGDQRFNNTRFEDFGL